MIQFLRKILITFLLINFALSALALAGEVIYDPETQTAEPEPLPMPVVKCLSPLTHISVASSLGILVLCEQGEGLKKYRVSLGSGGIDKRLEGDRKTPIGIYTLGQPKASDRFGTFIPVGYPTAAQKAAGFTGADVGIHGPDRAFQFLGDITVMINWTAGCIALGYDLEINEIKDWVKLKHPKFIQITP